jgi:hypothetical protein
MSTVLNRKFACFSHFLWVFGITDDLLVGILVKFDSASVTKKKTKRTIFYKILKATTLTLPYSIYHCSVAEPYGNYLFRFRLRI